MIKFTQEFYDEIMAEERMVWLNDKYDKIAPESLDRINKFIDFINTARFTGFSYKPRKSPNRYFFIRDYKNKAFSVDVVLNFEYAGKILPITVKGRYGGLDTLTRDISRSLGMPAFGQPYGTPEGAVYAHFSRNSFKCKDGDLEILYWPRYTNLFRELGEMEKVNEILSKYEAKNSNVSMAHTNALIKINPIIDYGDFLQHYKSVLGLVNQLRSRGIERSTIDKMFKLGQKFAHEESLMTPENMESIINLVQVQNVHRK